MRVSFTADSRHPSHDWICTSTILFFCNMGIYSVQGKAPLKSHGTDTYNYAHWDAHTPRRHFEGCHFRETVFHFSMLNRWNTAASRGITFYKASVFIHTHTHTHTHVLLNQGLMSWYHRRKIKSQEQRCSGYFWEWPLCQSDNSAA